MKNLQNLKRLMFAILFCIAIVPTFISCDAEDEDNSNNNSNSGSNTAVWQRYGSPRGYNTDLAVGNIPGEPSNRVYMCEHPGSPTAGLYKGTISGNTITWDAVHGLPNAEFSTVGDERTLYFGVGAVADAGKYRKGVWTGTCGELKNTPKNIYYRWISGSNCPIPSGYSVTFNIPGLPSSLTKNQQYGPIAAGSIEFTVNSVNGPATSNNTLSEPALGYKRTYVHNIFQFNEGVNRCVFYLNAPEALTYIDERL